METETNDGTCQVDQTHDTNPSDMDITSKVLISETEWAQLEGEFEVASSCMLPAATTKQGKEGEG
jgi:hypothetical protein